LSAIHAQRETFQDADSVRVHPVIRSSDDAVNVIPSDVHLETYVRARTVAAIDDAQAKVDRALQAGALATGTELTLETLPGYLPLASAPSLSEVFRRNVLELMPEERCSTRGHMASSTDMGDVSQIMPAIHPTVGGAEGGSHTTAFHVVDPELAYVLPAKLLAMSAVDLLADGAGEARKVLAASPPRITKDEYLKYMANCTRTEIFGR